MKNFLWIQVRAAAAALRNKKGSVMLLYLLAAFGVLILFAGLGVLLWMEIESWKE